jgi:hypothetical protein
MRDLRSIYTKLLQVLYPPQGGSRSALRDWDLWGPLVICLSLAITLSLDVSSDGSRELTSVATGAGDARVLARHLARDDRECRRDGQLQAARGEGVSISCSLYVEADPSSFFQSLCVLGYALAPLLLASIVALLLHNLFVRVPVSLACWAWSVWGELLCCYCS